MQAVLVHGKYAYSACTQQHKAYTRMYELCTSGASRALARVPSALLPLQRRTYAPTHAHTLSPTLAAPVLNHNPFRSEELSTASGPPDEHTLATAVPGSSDPRPPEVREPCRPFGPLAMPDQMGRCSGDPPLHLGWVTRQGRTERLSGERTRAQPGTRTRARLARLGR